MKGNEYKYDIISSTVVRNLQDYHQPESQKITEAIYTKYKKTLNNYAYMYSVSTGINKADLFGEALVGLTKAYINWGSGRNYDIDTFVRFSIRDALNEYIKNNKAVVTVPTYIKKASTNLNTIKNICAAYNVEWRLIIDGNFPAEFIKADADKCTKALENILKASERAKVEFKKFVDRVELLPNNLEFIDQYSSDSVDEVERVEAAIVVDNMKKFMDSDTLHICEGIMADKSLRDIGKEMGKSVGWISGKLKSFRERMVSLAND